MRRCGMRWSRATGDRWAARGVPFAVKFIAFKKVLSHFPTHTAILRVQARITASHRTAKLSWLWPG
eukprot:5914513-Prymnesium_polylepis.1